MKVYGETIFDIAYLLTAIIIGFKLLSKSQDKLVKLMGMATLVLGLGDAFHLVPRMLDYFVEANFTAPLGIGKLITSITMTIFYVMMYHIYQMNYQKEETKTLRHAIYGLALIRILLCLLPQNRWLMNSTPLAMGIIRNIPFVILGIVIMAFYFKERKTDKIFQHIWLYVLLSFLFYIPVVVGASSVPMLGMLMLPKTICYVLIMMAFRQKGTTFFV